MTGDKIMKGSGSKMQPGKKAELMELRRKIKSKKPDFLMQDHYRRKELPKKWRKPRGLHSKMRMRKAGHPKRVEIGYGSPRETRHLNRKGLKPVQVSNVQQLKGIDKSAETAVISHGVGIKKKLDILKAAEQEGITVANAKTAKIEKKIVERKGLMEEKAKELKEKEAKHAQKAEQEKVPEEATEHAREAEKKEKDKVLIKRDI